MSKVFITGVTGQDGTLLAKKLISNGDDVYGGYRRGHGKLWRHEIVQMPKSLSLIEYEIGNGQELSQLISKFRFDQIYHLAGNSLTADSFKYPKTTFEINYFGVLEILEAVRISEIDCKIFVAGSSEIFGDSNLNNFRYDESSTIQPSNPYGISHAASKYLCDLYRKVYNLKIFYGIFFNHESYLRDSIFLPKKLAVGFDALRNKKISSIEIGDLRVSRDWSLASNFVNVMIKLMKTDSFENYVFASGKLVSVKALAEAFAIVFGFSPEVRQVNGQDEIVDAQTGQVLVKSNSLYFRRAETTGKAGNPSKIEKLTGESMSIKLTDLVRGIINLPS